MLCNYAFFYFGLVSEIVHFFSTLPKFLYNICDWVCHINICDQNFSPILNKDIVAQVNIIEIIKMHAIKCIINFRYIMTDN